MTETTEIYFSNNGDGPECARIISIVNGIAFMRRWLWKNERYAKRFSLPMWFLKSQSCGWVK